jgi:hypothetical protein
VADPAAASRWLDRAGLWVVLLAASAVLAYLAINLVLTLLGTGPTLRLGACLAAQPPGHVTGPPLQPPLPVLDPPVLRWSGLVVILCVIAFVVGNLWGRRRAVSHTRAAGQPGAAPAKPGAPLTSLWRRRRAGAADQPEGTLGPPSTLLQVALIGLFLVGTGALVFETVALARVQDQPQFWPITFYVRCANDVLSLPTLVGALLVSSMVGHLLGYQAKAGESG